MTVQSGLSGRRRLRGSRVTRKRARRRLRVGRVELGPRAAAVLGALAVLAGGLWLWLRDSPLVTVDRVTVAGLSGRDTRAIRSALVTAARGMTTLDVNVGQLRTAVSPYPEVTGLRVSAEVPHGLRITVIERLPVAALRFGGRTEAVAADGTLLHDMGAAALPTIALAIPPGGPRVTDPDALAEVRALASAPYQLLSRITTLSTQPGHGIVAQLRNGPALYLGDPTRMPAKWLAAMAVLADPGSAGASYVDVTDPVRPAAGGGGSTTPSGG